MTKELEEVEEIMDDEESIHLLKNKTLRDLPTLEMILFLDEIMLDFDSNTELWIDHPLDCRNILPTEVGLWQYGDGNRYADSIIREHKIGYSEPLRTLAVAISEYEEVHPEDKLCYKVSGAVAEYIEFGMPINTNDDTGFYIIKK